MESEVLEKNSFPKARIVWIRGKETINLDEPKTWVNIGQKHSGKSSLNEALAANYPKIIDLFGSRDNEGLAWCRSPLKDSVVFITGDSVKVSCEWPIIRLSELAFGKLKDYDVCLTVHAFYGNLSEEFKGLNKILDVLYSRTHWAEPWALAIREAANFIYSRITLGKNQFEAKAEFIYLLREGWHMGYAVGVDTIRWTSIDIEIRDVSDYIFIKSIGRKGLPPELRFVYGYIDPFSLMKMPQNQFVIVTDTGSIGVGTFEYPEWHKKKHEDILGKLNIDIEYGEIPNYGNDRRKVLSDFQHAEIVRLYNDENLSMGKIAERIQCSPATVKNQLDKHDKASPCPICSRIKP